jgi:hypothetical protein
MLLDWSSRLVLLLFVRKVVVAPDGVIVGAGVEDELLESAQAGVKTFDVPSWSILRCL